MRAFLRFFFRLLYHPFAFSYDLVAATVSLGRWKDWVLSVLPFIQGTRVLEIGHGPGHLQRALLARSLFAFGIDESAQMGRLARHNLARTSLGYPQSNLTRGLAQALPFPNGFFDTLVATFPADYIVEPATLAEASRVLVPNGRFVILPGASILGRHIMDRIMAFIFHITGQAPTNISEIIHERSRVPFARANFRLEFHELEIRSSRVFIVIAIKDEKGKI